MYVTHTRTPSKCQHPHAHAHPASACPPSQLGYLCTRNLEVSELFSLLILAPVSSSFHIINIDNTSISIWGQVTHTHTYSHTCQTEQALHSRARNLSFIFHIRGQQQTTKLCFKAQKANFPFIFFKKKKQKPNRLVAFILVLSLSLALTHTLHTHTHTETDTVHMPTNTHTHTLHTGAHTHTRVGIKH